jgi:hypothetical protein
MGTSRGREWLNPCRPRASVADSSARSTTA